MLLRETGQYLFEHTVGNLLEGGAVQRVILATDSEEILAAAEEVGIEALMTSPAHRSGTDRVKEAYDRLLESGSEAYDIVVNVQGDEPDVAPDDLQRLVAAFIDPAVELATLWTGISDAEELLDESAVKVVLDEGGDALYFSRAPIPNRAHERASGVEQSVDSQVHKRHVGVYGFRPGALARFCALPEGALERLENLEQLRWLGAGKKLRVLEARHRPHGIDTVDDYRAFVIRQSTP
jgi:3-deoxy-manno-octulosonate cytidylyltransferase (CMP-KDO synthetase)